MHKLIPLCCGSLLIAQLAIAAPTSLPKTVAGVETCLQAAQSRLQGQTVKLELKTEAGKPVYEIEIAGKDRVMEFACDATSGKITEEEQEVEGPDHALFKAKAKISPEQARAIALKAQAGEIVELEYEIESGGGARYEFDIRKDDGREVKLEIDAATGAVIEGPQDEIYQIGQEP